MSSPIEEIRLIERCQKGDRTSLDELVQRYQGRAYQFAYRISGDMETASDLVAEGFVRAYLNIKNFRKDSRFSTWLYRIITNCFLDLQKRERIRQHDSIEALVQTEEGAVSKQFTSDEKAPSTMLEENVRNEALSKAIAKLPEYHKVMIVMYHFENLSYEEIAEAMDMPVGTVKSRLNRARLTLRGLLEPVEELFST